MMLFEKFEDFLYLENETRHLTDDLELLPLFCDIIKRVEKEPTPGWNTYSLRKYLLGFYSLSVFFGNEQPSSGFSKQEKEYVLNIYSTNNFGLFFTGLYCSKKYCGFKDGLFIVCERDGNVIKREIISRSQIIRDKRQYISCYFSDANDVIFRNLSSFEDWIGNGSLSPLEDIKLPDVIIDFAAFQDDLNCKLSSLKQKKKGENIPDNWLHLLIDGIDNIPLDSFRMLFEKDAQPPLSRMRTAIESIKCKDGKFDKYQKSMLAAIERAIQTNDLSQLPVNFYLKRNNGSSPFQYLLPIDFQNTGKIDFCICVDPSRSRVGKVLTSLKMYEVYGNIRTFGKDALYSVANWWT